MTIIMTIIIIIIILYLDQSKHYIDTCKPNTGSEVTHLRRSDLLGLIKSWVPVPNTNF